MNENDSYKIRSIGIDRPILIQLHEALDFRQEKHASESSMIFSTCSFHIPYGLNLTGCMIEGTGRVYLQPSVQNTIITCWTNWISAIIMV